MAFNSLLNVAKYFLTSKSERINARNKNIRECGQIDMQDYLQNTFYVNTIVSGTAQFVRNIVLRTQIQCATAAGLPVVILHSSNTQLPAEIMQVVGQSHVSIVHSSSANFAPFLGLDDQETIDVILDSIPDKYDVKQNARYYLEAIAALMKANRMAPSFHNFLTCPHDTVLDRVDRSLMAGKISDASAQTLRSKIMIGQGEHFKIDSFLHNLSKQMGRALHNKKTATPPISIYETLNKGGVIAIDVGSSFNSIYVDFLIEQLKVANNRGRSFLLVLDSMSIHENKKMKEVLTGGSSSIKFLISCDDLLSACGGEQSLFSAVVASAKQYMIFSHTSATSAGQWASVLGEYERIDENITKSQSRTDDGMGFWSLNVDNKMQKTHAVSTSKRRDFIVPPEAIVSMQNNELYIRSENFSGITHGYITN